MTEERVVKMNKRGETKISLCSRKQRASVIGLGPRKKEEEEETRGRPLEGKKRWERKFLLRKKRKRG